MQWFTPQFISSEYNIKVCWLLDPLVRSPVGLWCHLLIFGVTCDLLTTFHNKRRHSFETKEKAVPINIATIDQKVKHYKLKNPQNQVTNFYEDARLFTDSKPVTSVIALLPVWWAYVNIQRISAEAALCLRLQVIWIRHSPECTWPRPCERQPFGNFGKRNFRQLSAIFKQGTVENSRNWTDPTLIWEWKDRPALLTPSY